MDEAGIESQGLYGAQAWSFQVWSHTYEWTGLEGKDMDNLDLVLDFGGNAENTVVTVSQIIVQEHNPIQ